jgi:hypothetical protein
MFHRAGKVIQVNANEVKRPYLLFPKRGRMGRVVLVGR